MKSFLLPTLMIILLIVSCKDDEEPHFVDVTYEKVTEYAIDMEGNQVTGYSTYINDTLQYITTFVNGNHSLERITKTAKGTVSDKRVYTLGENDLATSSVDSVFGSKGLSLTWITYTYENGYLKSETIRWNRAGSVVDTGSYFLNYTFENGNLVSTQESAYLSATACTHYHSYSGNLNRIDIRGFSNNITGPVSKNLVTHTSWYNGCPCGPSSSIAFSDYTYEIGNEGLVTQMTEKYTPCYHLTSPGEVTRLIFITKYRYNLK